MKKYQAPAIEAVVVSSLDVITASITVKSVHNLNDGFISGADNVWEW